MASTKKNEFSLLKQRADKYALTVSQRFSKAVNDILALQKEYSLEEGEVFSFDDNPRIARQVQDILRELHSATETAIHNGIKLEWKNANDAIDSLLESKMGKEAMHDATFAGWMARDNEARDAFMKRRVAGMSLSDRIWRTEKQLRTEMELALSVSIGEGKSASEVSREVRKYLQEPDRLFRRVRMSDGSMRLSRAAAAYHPGQGVYRSSYKNAMRLARTETNMAYRAADFERWKRLDFVTGVRIGLSGSHPDYDVCDRLRGDYPKDFKFSGWHPNCFCNAVPITVSDDDFVKMQQAMLAGEDYDVSSQMVKDVPDGFDEWAKENKDRIIQARKNGTSPYFVRDNEKYVRIALGEEPRPRLMSAPAPTIIPEPGNMPEPGRSALGAEFPDFKPQIAKSIDEAQEKAEDIVIGKLAKEKFELFPASAPSDRGDLIAKMRVLFKENGLSLKNGVDISTVPSPTLAGVYAKYVKVHNASIKRYEKAYTKAEAILGKVGSSIHPAAKEQYAKFVEEFNAALASGEFVDKDNLISGILNLDKLIKEGVDFAKVSTKMPAELLEGKGWLLSGDSLDKRFFDNITGYVPVNVGKTGGTAFSPWKKMVTLNMTDPRYTSKFFRESTVYHEYGHAIDGTSKMFATKDIDDLMAKWLAEFSKNSSDIEKKIDDLRRNKVAGSQEKTPLSMFTKAIDTIQSVTKGKHGGLKYGGHSISYWAGPGHCRNEFIAHMSEFANLDNPIAKDLLGDLYNEMRTLCRKLYGY